jgi:hypothetical protein
VKKLLLLISVTLSAQASIAASPDIELFSLGPGFKIVYAIDADYSFASGAITSQLGAEYYRNGFITTAMKDEVSNNLFRNNVFGGEYNTSITVGQNLDTIFGLLSGSSYIRLSNRAHIDSKFEDDLFEMFFRGNKNYAGKNADLGPFSLKSYTYQQFSYGIERHKQSKKKNITWSAGVSLNIGQKYTGFESPGTTLYTADDGSYLDIDLDLTIRNSDSSHSNLGSFNGFGFSGTGMLIIKDENQNAWAFSADNLGYIRWTKESSEVPVDTTFRFEGIDATDLFDFSDSIRKEITTDSAYVQAFLTKRSKGSFTEMLPFHLRASYTAQLKPGKLILQIGAEHILFANARLKGFSALKYTIKKRHQLAVNLSYGGYTFWNIGIAYNGQIGKSWVFRTGTDYLSSMFNKKRGLAHGAFVSLEKYF